eukprot:13860040-Alexandrium_andersonii.AAC.1
MSLRALHHCTASYQLWTTARRLHALEDTCAIRGLHYFATVRAERRLARKKEKGAQWPRCGTKLASHAARKRE